MTDFKNLKQIYRMAPQKIPDVWFSDEYYTKGGSVYVGCGRLSKWIETFSTYNDPTLLTFRCSAILDYSSTDVEIQHLQRIEKEHKRNLDLFRGEKSLTKKLIKRRRILKLLLDEFDSRYELIFGGKTTRLFVLALQNLITVLVHRKKRMEYSRHDWQRFTTQYGIERRNIRVGSPFSTFAESCAKGITVVKSLQDFWLKYYHFMGVAWDDIDRQQALAVEVMTEDQFFSLFGHSIAKYYEGVESSNTSKASATQAKTGWD